MAVFKVQAGDTYESIAARTGSSAGAVMRYFKGRPLHKGMKYNTRKLYGMAQGSQAYYISQGMNPWGLEEGDIPDSAWETTSGTNIANEYLRTLGMAGTGEGEAGLGITTEETSERPPAAEAPQALTTGPEQLTTGAGVGVTTTGERPPVTEAPQAQMVGSEQLPAGIGTTPAAIPEIDTYAQMAGRRPGRPGVPSVSPMGLEEAYKVAADWAMGTMLPEGYEISFSAQPPGEVSGATPGGGVYDPETGQRYRTPTDVPGQPQVTYEPGRGQAAIDVYQAIKEGETPGAISPETAVLLGYSDEILGLAGYVLNSETGQWELDMLGAEEEGGEVAGGGGGTYGGGYGGYRRRRRGGGGGRRSYGSTMYNGQVNTRFNWRIGWR